VDGLAESDTVKAGLTVTVTVAVAVPPRESVTLTQYVVVDVGETGEVTVEPEQVEPYQT
jgi:hypothetical protein